MYCGQSARGDSTRCANVDLSLRAILMDAECECRLGFLALGRWCRQWRLVVVGRLRQLAVYCLDVAVITVASLVRLTSIAAVPTGAIAT